MADTAPPIDYKKKFAKIMARLRAGGGLGLFKLQDGESTEITIIGDVDDWMEIPVHQLKKERRRALCGELINEPCAYCDQGLRQGRRLAIPIYNEGLGQVQIAFWAQHADSPLVEMEEAYKVNGVPFRGMQFTIKRRGTELETRYPMTYRGHKTGDLTDLRTEPDMAEVKIPSRTAVVNLLVAVLSGGDE
jgi:hypothetical protein